MDKTYRPADVEDRIYARWEKAGAFACGRADAPEAERAPYSIVIPPPNVTGSLHMGHALNNTLQDILIRFARMQGRDALWQPGTDHAGIATQMVVERQLEAEGKTRHDLGREAFIRRVWEWKAESGGTITGQLRRLGASCDWSRERFTMGRRAVASGPHGLRHALQGRADLSRQAAGKLGSKAAYRDFRPRSRAARGQGQALVYRLSDRGRRRADHHRGYDTARDHARRHRGRGPSRRRALPRPGGQACDPAHRRAPAADRRRQLHRSGQGVGRGQDHPGPRLQRFRGRAPPRP